MLRGAAASSQGPVHESGSAAALARWCLRVLDQPWPKDESLSDRQRAVLATIDRKQLEAKLGWLRDYRQAIDEWSQWHEVIQVVVRQARRHGIDRDSVAELQRQFTAMKLSPSGQETAEVMMEFIAEQAWVARLGGELLIVSTEILESLFGAYKNLEGQQSESGVTGLMLVVECLCPRGSRRRLRKAWRQHPGRPWKPGSRNASAQQFNRNAEPCKRSSPNRNKSRIRTDAKKLTSSPTSHQPSHSLCPWLRFTKASYTGSNSGTIRFRPSVRVPNDRSRPWLCQSAKSR